jgi:hypothetical protein
VSARSLPWSVGWFVTDETLLSQQILEDAYVALQANEIAAFCKMHTGPALERLLELSQTAGDPRLRRKASALLAAVVGRLCESGLNVSRESTEQRASGPTGSASVTPL